MAQPPDTVALRPEIILAPEPDGSVLAFDPILDRLHRFGPAEAARLTAPDAALSGRLQGAMLLEGPTAEALRRQAVQARIAVPPLPPAAAEVAAVDWSQAEDLPDGVATRWRDGENLRRKAEDRAAGRAVVVLEGFLAPAFLAVVERELQALSPERLQTPVVRGWRCRVQHGLPGLREVLSAPETRGLLGAVLGVALPEGLEINAWTLDPGDHMQVHPDGSRYRATFALGLNAGWRARDGGAIAWGTPGPGGAFEVRERWLPHRGDLCLFVPDATTWHRVESPARQRRTVSGWWTGA